MKSTVNKKNLTPTRRKIASVINFNDDPTLNDITVIKKNVIGKCHA